MRQVNDVRDILFKPNVRIMLISMPSTLIISFMFSVVYCAQINLQRNFAAARLMFNK